jgi:branched-chain amino acid transport system ATP-binding protein
MLQFENVSTFYGKIQALHSVNVEVRQGEIVTLIGANGAGKSTLLMTLCGSPRAHSGSIRYMGEELVGQESSVIMRKSIAVVPEGRRVFARLTVEENLAMGGFFTDKGDYQEQMDKVLRTVSTPQRTLSASAAAPCPAASSRCSPSAVR